MCAAAYGMAGLLACLTFLRPFRHRAPLPSCLPSHHRIADLLLCSFDQELDHVAPIVPAAMAGSFGQFLHDACTSKGAQDRRGDAAAAQPAAAAALPKRVSSRRRLETKLDGGSGAPGPNKAAQDGGHKRAAAAAEPQAAEAETAETGDAVAWEDHTADFVLKVRRHSRSWLSLPLHLTHSHVLPLPSPPLPRLLRSRRARSSAPVLLHSAHQHQCDHHHQYDHKNDHSMWPYHTSASMTSASVTTPTGTPGMTTPPLTTTACRRASSITRLPSRTSVGTPPGLP